MSIETVTKEVRFVYRTWSVQGSSVKPVKGSWTLPPPRLKKLFTQPELVKALISCPQCNQASILTVDQLDVAPTLHIATVKNMECRACKFHCTALLTEYDRRKLYCVAYEVTVNGQPEGRKEYFHGVDSADVTTQFFNGHINDKIDQVVGVGVVIGLFVDDEQGKILHV